MGYYRDPPRYMSGSRQGIIALDPDSNYDSCCKKTFSTTGRKREVCIALIIIFLIAILIAGAILVYWVLRENQDNGILLQEESLTASVTEISSNPVKTEPSEVEQSSVSPPSTTSTRPPDEEKDKVVVAKLPFDLFTGMSDKAFSIISAPDLNVNSSPSEAPETLDIVLSHSVGNNVRTEGGVISGVELPEWAFEDPQNVVLEFETTKSPPPTHRGEVSEVDYPQKGEELLGVPETTFNFVDPIYAEEKPVTSSSDGFSTGVTVQATTGQSQVTQVSTIADNVSSLVPNEAPKDLSNNSHPEPTLGLGESLATLLESLFSPDSNIAITTEAPIEIPGILIPDNLSELETTELSETYEPKTSAPEVSSPQNVMNTIIRAGETLSRLLEQEDMSEGKVTAIGNQLEEESDVSKTQDKIVTSKPDLSESTETFKVDDKTLSVLSTATGLMKEKKNEIEFKQLPSSILGENQEDEDLKDGFLAALLKGLISRPSETYQYSPDQSSLEPLDDHLFIPSYPLVPLLSSDLLPSSRRVDAKENLIRERSYLHQDGQLVGRQENPTVPEGVCRRRGLEFCRDTLTYEMTSLPNILGEKTLNELALNSLPYLQLVTDSQCNSRIKSLACSIMEPPCVGPGAKVLPPCRQFCKVAMRGCKDYIIPTLALSDVFKCENYPDSNDPNVCVNLAQNCSPDEFQCPDKTCVPPAWVCDGVRDCSDNGDEVNCTTCSDTEFRCSADGKCVPDRWRCDGSHDCVDGSDESDCDVKGCGYGFFKCHDGSGCIPERWVCDGNNHCRDNSDEPVNCTAIECQQGDFKCVQSGLCVPGVWRCDGNSDCRDNSDEFGCAEINRPLEDQGLNNHQLCPPGMLRCLNGSCIQVQDLCDGVPQCPDGEDEAKCG